MNAGERIREVRKERNMTVAALAAASNLTKGFISQVESGKSNPSLASLARIAAALQVPPASLVARARPKNERNTPAIAPSIISAHNIYQENAGLTPLSELQTGTHFLATIPPGYALNSGSMNHHSSDGNALLLVIQGVVEIRQASSMLHVSVGQLATFDAHGPYTIENSNSSKAVVLLLLPDHSPAPKLLPLPGRELRPKVQPPALFPVEGPMRLVEMRARRQAERRR